MVHFYLLTWLFRRRFLLRFFFIWLSSCSFILVWVGLFGIARLVFLDLNSNCCGLFRGLFCLLLFLGFFGLTVKTVKGLVLLGLGLSLGQTKPERLHFLVIDHKPRSRRLEPLLELGLAKMASFAAWRLGSTHIFYLGLLCVDAHLLL